MEKDLAKQAGRTEGQETQKHQKHSAYFSEQRNEILYNEQKTHQEKKYGLAKSTKKNGNTKQSGRLKATNQLEFNMATERSKLSPLI